jgi:hypothetical protein
MKVQILSALAGTLSILVGFANDFGSTTNGPTLGISLASLPSIQGGNYKVDPYIKAAGELQAAGKEAAFQHLLILARSSEHSQFEDRQRIAVLCRMLFTNRLGADFKRPALGGPSFLGKDLEHLMAGLFGSGSSEWPLEPIELVEGIPFAIVSGYSYQGRLDPRGAELYVRYCITNCDWSTGRFAVKSKQQKEAALRKLISSPKWQQSIEGWELEFLRKQIE